MKPPTDPQYRHPDPVEIVSHAVWLYHVFSLSLRDMELIVAERRIVVSYETARPWCMKFDATSPTACDPPGKTMAHGRGVRSDPGRAALSLARR